MRDTLPNSRMGAGGVNARCRKTFARIVFGALERWSLLTSQMLLVLELFVFFEENLCQFYKKRFS